MPTETAVIPSFGIEINHPRNCDVLIQSLPGCRLRSQIDGSKPVIGKDGEEAIPLDQSHGMASCPKVPGMEIHVNPEELTVVIRDPLNDDEPLLERLTAWLRKRTPLRTADKIRGVPTRTEKVDAHVMKTLCRELVTIVQLGHGRRAAGVVPDVEDVDELPGRYLLNPGLRTATTQPRYEDQWDKWVSELHHGGG